MKIEIEDIQELINKELSSTLDQNSRHYRKK